MRTAPRATGLHRAADPSQIAGPGPAAAGQPRGHAQAQPAAPAVTLRSYSQDDLTKRAQIIDAAIIEFAQNGMKASVRSIAARANVSPGLITHHFGGKAALRQECDDEVFRQYMELKMGGVADPLTSVGRVFDDSGELSVMVCYMIRSLLDGGQAARRFMDQLMDNTRTIVEASVAKGLIRPSRDEEARIRYMTQSNIGAAIVRFVLDPPEDVSQALTTVGTDPESLLAQVEVLTEGVFTSTLVYDAVKEQLLPAEKPSHPAGPSPTGAGTVEPSEPTPPSQSDRRVAGPGPASDEAAQILDP